jgi:hypothetical protein
VVNGKWRKEDELKKLKTELFTLERKIKVSLNHQVDSPLVGKPKEKEVVIVAEREQKYKLKVS